MKVRRIARQNDHGSRRVRLQLTGVEFVAEANVKHPGNNGINAIFRVSVWHQFHAMRYSNPDDVRSCFRWLTNNNGKPHRRWEGGEWLPVDVFS